MKTIFFALFPLFVLAKPGYFEPWGKDSDLIQKKEKSLFENTSPSILTRGANQIIRFHQHFFSPIDGPRSSFRPTSSRYMQLAMQRYGFFKGFIMGCDRLLRENNEEWIYQKVIIDGYEYKYDPARLDKHFR